MNNLNVNMDLSPIIHQLCKNEGATVALAKSLLKDDELKIFSIEARIQTLYSLVEFIEKFPDVFSGVKEMIKSVELSITELEKERAELIQGKDPVFEFSVK